MSDEVQQFYDKWSDIYDAFSSNPLVQKWRKKSIDDLDLSEDATVVDVGCGTGANLPILQKAVPYGQVFCLDISKGSLMKVEKRVEDNNYQNVQPVRGDGARIPIKDIDCIYASFSVGMFPNSRQTVEHWIECVGNGGKIGMLNTVKSHEQGTGALVNKPIQVFTGLTTPNTSIDEKLELSYSGNALDSLDRKIRMAEETLEENSSETARDSFFRGSVSSIAVEIE
jgi:ubiquinone/menaquinone biosynthesis C-methylase UbiE